MSTWNDFFLVFLQLHTFNGGNYDTMEASFYKDNLDSFM